VVLKKAEPQLAVPEAALFDLGEGPLLSVVRDGKIKVLHPEVGTAQGGNVAVAKTDLKEGEPVVVEGGYNVPENTLATILPDPPATPAAESKADAPAESKDPPKAESKDSPQDGSKAKDSPQGESKEPEKAKAKGGERE
jgi:hypothetical protein